VGSSQDLGTIVGKIVRASRDLVLVGSTGGKGFKAIVSKIAKIKADDGPPRTAARLRIKRLMASCHRLSRFWVSGMPPAPSPG
jgi:hypothetical protein